MKGAAHFSSDRHYRYLLMRRWSDGDRWINFIMLNPSTATAEKNDPTIRRCINFSKQLKADGLLVTNLYAKRATDPRDLINYPDPVGPKNNQYIDWAAQRSERTIVGWGNSARKVAGFEDRIVEVLKLLNYPFGVRLYCFGFTATGQPRHPLMLRNDVKLKRY